MKVTGVADVLANITKSLIAIQKSVEKEVERAALEVEREAKINQTPHVDTGRLRASISAVKVGPLTYHVGVYEEAPIGGARFEVGSNVEYAEKHEFQYPYLGPAIAYVRQKYPNLIKEGVKLR